MTDDSKVVEVVARVVAQFIQPLPYDELPKHRKAVTPRAEFGQMDMDEIAEAAIAAYKAHLEREGMVVVPRAPTEEMCDAGVVYMNSDTGLIAKNAYQHWCAMIDSIKQG